jgi:hypothetical protein
MKLPRKLSKDFLLASTIAAPLLIFVSLAAGQLVLSDRNRYVSAEISSLTGFDRTSLVDFVFGLSPFVEPILSFFNIFLLLLLCRLLSRSFRLIPRQRYLLYITAFLPFRLLFRSYASKELLFSLASEIFLITILSSASLFSGSVRRDTSIFPAHVQHRGNPLFDYALLISTFLLCLLIRPFYAVILPIPFLLSSSSVSLSLRLRKSIVLAAVVLAASGLLYTFFALNYFHAIVALMENYFLIDGANSTSLRAHYASPSAPLDFIFQFASSFPMSLLGPSPSDIRARPFLIFLFLEGAFLILLMVSGFFNLFVLRTQRLLSAHLSLALALLSFYILFVFYIFSAINFMGGIRYQACMTPLLLYLYAYTCSLRSKALPSIKALHG